MAAKRPTDGTTLIKATHPQCLIRKTISIRNAAMDFLTPHVRKIVRAFHRENLGDPVQRYLMR